MDETLFQAYGQRLEELGALDFDDLLLRALEVDVTGRRSFLHLLVDEFQDVSEVQYRLVRAWSGRGRSLFVIGDPDQSVYGFRGASPGASSSSGRTARTWGSTGCGATTGPRRRCWPPPCR